MVGAHPQNSLTPSQMQAQQQAHAQATARAKLRSQKPTDKNIPEGVEDCIIGDGVQRYRDLRDIERRLDSTMMRKRLDLQDSVNRNVKRYRTLRIWVSNTVEDQPWQADTLDMDSAFDFNTNMDSSYRVKIEGRLLDEEDDGIDSDEDDEDGDEVEDEDAMDEDNKEKKKKSPTPTKSYKFSHFFKAMTVDFDRNKAKDGSDQSVEWKKPAVPANARDLPNAADFDQLEFKRGGDENMNVTINLVRDETPERFALSPALAEVLDTNEATRAESVMGIWEYVKAMGLEEDEEKRTFNCDDRLRAVDDPLRAALASYLTNESYTKDLQEVIRLNEHTAVLVQKIANSKSKHTFFEALSKNPTEFIAKWLSSQKRDLEIIAGEATRGGGEDAGGDEWRKGGRDSIWGSENVRESYYEKDIFNMNRHSIPFSARPPLPQIGRLSKAMVVRVSGNSTGSSTTASLQTIPNATNTV
ncbi:putative SWI/SNF and RSC complexes subunit ssr3 [Glarea lozoyensis 74030]|uniref:Putative SWI/SNF and RSC complexes subunit ssr3 n=1 Tax=Glarea lozoyensis (strain ATCC 74030 / MF5533) TaxID=1104152 RepID=H0EIA7_GLAL7|nr:putative SWI/SNF and RSC complexes subunit ssr3 [Glarea lozoyensis 74030]